jgi:AcrR family transcriptional regulator
MRAAFRPTLATFRRNQEHRPSTGSQFPRTTRTNKHREMGRARIGLEAPVAMPLAPLLRCGSNKRLMFAAGSATQLPYMERYMPHLSQKSLRRDRIVHAAGRLFAYQGYHGTSTRQIAHLASMSENTLFRHFDDKESLFWSTLSEHFAVLDLQMGLLDKIANCEPPEVVLPEILELFADTVSYRPELLRLTAVAFLEMHPKGEAFLHERLSPALTAIFRYLETSIKGGKLRNFDPATVTVALTMTALTHEGISHLIDKDKPLLSHQEKNRAQARFWLDVLAPGMPAQVTPATTIREKDPG